MCPNRKIRKNPFNPWFTPKKIRVGGASVKSGQSVDNPKQKLEALRASALFLTSDFTDLTDGGYAGLGVETGRVRGCFIRVIRVISGSIKNLRPLVCRAP